ncbi:MAG: hypothetical protein J6X83_01815 [Methanomicrobium sp.]|nr:hypothetical protein [Methanomicrobium sp.]
MEIEVLQIALATITLILGVALIVYLYQGYRVVKNRSFLLLIYGLFVLTIGIVLPDISSILDPEMFWFFWSSIFSRVLVFIGMCTMIFSIMRG